MRKKMENAISWLYVFAPVACILVGAYLNEWSMKNWDHWISYVLQIVLAVIGIVTTITVLESKFMKTILLILYALLILVAGQGLVRSGSGTTGTKVYHQTFDASENDGNSSPVQSGGTKGNNSGTTNIVNTSSKCNYCDGSGYCDKCGGLGEDLCSCLGGSCPSCSGIGHKMVYTKDGYKYPDCKTCGGSGNHQRCNGTGFLKCTRCDGTGVCPYCDGTGEK